MALTIKKLEVMTDEEINALVEGFEDLSSEDQNTFKTFMGESFTSSYGVNAVLPDPVSKGDNKRPADKTEGERAMPKLQRSEMIAQVTDQLSKLSHMELDAKYREFFNISQGGNASADANRATIKGKGFSEDVKELFSGDELSEDFKVQASALFEAAVQNKVIQERVKLEEQFEQRFEEELAEAVKEIEEGVSKYMDHVAEEWLEENRLQVESGIRADVLDNFMEGLKNLFIEHYIDVPADKVDVVESLTNKIEELEGKLNEQINESLDKDKEIAKLTAARVFDEVTEGLTDSQADRLQALAEEIEFESEESYRNKLTTIAEGFVVAKKPTVSAAEQLSEEVEIDDAPRKSFNDPLIASVSEAISRSAKK